MIDVIVTRKSMIAEAICSLELTAVDGQPLPAFSAGSHIDVHLREGLVRQYSLCNAPGGAQHYEIAVLREEQSRGGSIAMHAVEQGERLTISEPRNLFPLAHDAKRSFLFAGGIGITPILCMAERLSRIQADFQLHYCARSAGRAAFAERIRQSSFAQQTQFYFDYPAGGARLAVTEALSPYTDGDHLYVCGPGGFIEYVLEQAQAAGWPQGSLHREFFSASPVVHDDDGSFEVQLVSTGRRFTVPADRSVAEVLDEAGVEIPLSCEQGICGTCLTRVLEGEPDHRDMFLTDEERARNDQFTPCCSRAKSARLVLDL